MKKVLSLMIVITLLMMTFVGCGNAANENAPTNTGTNNETTTTDNTTTDGDNEVIIFQNKVEIHEQLSAFAKLYTEETGVKVVVKTSGGDTPYADSLKAEFQSDRQPDIFVIEGMGGYNTWKANLTPFEGNEKWLENTSLAFAVDGTTYGFPVAVEAWGLAYNAAILEKAGVDPATLTSQEAYKAAFEKIDGMKDELGLESVVAMAAGPELTWVTGLHNFNGYLSAGLEYNDRTVLDKLNNGEADEARLAEYVDWVELLFNYADKAVLLTGNYDSQVGQFATQQAAFVHQGNWIDPWLLSNGVDFEMGFAPHASVKGTHDAIFIGAPSFYVINNNSQMTDEAKAFLEYLAMNENGHNYMVNEAKMIPAFTNVTMVPEAPLSANVTEWLAKENGSYTWLQNDMPEGFGMGTIAPIYENFAKGTLSKAEFLEALKAEIEKIQ